jgi:hypothetical protein
MRVEKIKNCWVKIFNEIMMLANRKLKAAASKIVDL